MSKPFDYSKWDKIELSDDEEDVHPNIDKESWFRMKHRSRVEREEHEEKDRKRINAEMEKSNQRIKLLEWDLKKLSDRAKDDSDDDDDDDIDGVEAIKTELKELRESNAKLQAQLDDYEKNKKWNVDNIAQVKDERTLINPKASEYNYTPTGYVKATTDGSETKAKIEAAHKEKEKEKAAVPKDKDSEKKLASAKTQAAPKKAAPKSEVIPKVMGPSEPPSTARTLARPSKPVTGSVDSDPDFAYSYHEFTERYADVVEEFMSKKTFEESKEFLLRNGEVLLQEHAANYLLLASLEDEMNGFRDKMKQTAKQSQIVSNIAELAKSMQTHPGNVIMPFFARMEQREFLMGFLSGVEAFVEKIIRRAVTKKMEIDRERAAGAAQDEQGVDLADIPLEERLGPGGLDPLEVIETLPIEMQKAFESRDVDMLRQVISSMDPKDAEYHMKRCVDSGLWSA